MEILRAPIIATLGHVDHGKTTLLDKIRGSAITLKEPGAITQSISSTLIPKDTILKISGSLLEKFKFQITIPGLLLIDTPGHEAFTTLRKRGGSIADLAIVVVDVKEGLMPQTKESLGILKQFKTPFVVVVNKIDRIHGWSSEKESFIENFNVQSEDVKNEFETLFYKIVEQMSTEGFVADRFDRITDFAKTIACVPISGKTGEGIPDLLAILSGLSQQFLKNRLIATKIAKGSILEVKEVVGLGTTIDVIIYDGVVRKNDYLVIGGKNARIVKIRALLEPSPLKDIRAEKKFTSIEEARAACGVKISAPGLDDVIAGSPVRTAKTLEEAENVFEEMEKSEEIEITTDTEGLILKADTIGSLEALINIFKKHPIREATIGQVTKEDVIKSESNKNAIYRIIIDFNAKINEDAEKMAKSTGIAIIQSDVIYRLLEDYEKWVKDAEEKTKKDELEKITHAGKIKILPGLVFRASNPAVVGCEIIGGIIKPGYSLMKGEKDAGIIKQIQSQGKNVDEAKIGDKVAVSITGVMIGRQIKESDVLYTSISAEDYRQLKKFSRLLTEHEKQIMEESEKKKKKRPYVGLLKLSG
jgi:translation initiation factor 5B